VPTGPAVTNTRSTAGGSTSGGIRVDVFALRNDLIGDYARYIQGFIRVRDERIRETIEREIREGLLWPEPLVQISPSFEPGGWIDDLVAAGLLHAECRRVFRARKGESAGDRPIRLHRHQVEAIEAAKTGQNYVLTTGTGSGKSLTYIVPIVDHVLRHGSGRGIQAVIVYPMNALANSQVGELEKFLCKGYPDDKGPVTFRRYTGQEGDQERQQIIARPPRHPAHQLRDAGAAADPPVREAARRSGPGAAVLRPG